MKTEVDAGAILGLSDDNIGPRAFLVGSQADFWRWKPGIGWDLTRSPDADSISPQRKLALECSVSNIVIDPDKTALVIIDMQNFALSRTINPDLTLSMVRAEENLMRYAIPAARQARIQILWLNWGLTEQDLQNMPASSMRVFGWQANTPELDYGKLQCGEIETHRGLGADLGRVALPDGNYVEAGRVLMKGTWNAALHGPLSVAFDESRTTAQSDMLFDKVRNSGLYDPQSECNIYLKRQGIKTLLFSGVNTDQCVMATLQDAHAWGFDTVLLGDCCATDSPDYTQQSAEFNCCRAWGFLSTSQALAAASNILIE